MEAESCQGSAQSARSMNLDSINRAQCVYLVLLKMNSITLFFVTSTPAHAHQWHMMAVPVYNAHPGTRSLLTPRDLSSISSLVAHREFRNISGAASSEHEVVGQGLRIDTSLPCLSALATIMGLGALATHLAQHSQQRSTALDLESQRLTVSLQRLPAIPNNT